MLVSEEWIRKHRSDLDNWHPKIVIVSPGSKQTFNIKSEEAMRAVVKTMKEGRKHGRNK